MLAMVIRGGESVEQVEARIEVQSRDWSGSFTVEDSSRYVEGESLVLRLADGREGPVVVSRVRDGASGSVVLFGGDGELARPADPVRVKG